MKAKTRIGGRSAPTNDLIRVIAARVLQGNFTIPELSLHLGHQGDPRVLRNQVGELVKEGLVMGQGSGRGRCYRLASSTVSRLESALARGLSLEPLLADVPATPVSLTPASAGVPMTAPVLDQAEIYRASLEAMKLYLRHPPPGVDPGQIQASLGDLLPPAQTSAGSDEPGAVSEKLKAGSAQPSTSGAQPSAHSDQLSAVSAPQEAQSDKLKAGVTQPSAGNSEQAEVSVQPTTPVATLSTLNPHLSTPATAPSTLNPQLPTGASAPSTSNSQLPTGADAPAASAPAPGMVAIDGVWYYMDPEPGGRRLKYEHGAWVPVDHLPLPPPPAKSSTLSTLDPHLSTPASAPSTLNSQPSTSA